MREKTESRLGEVVRFALTGGICFLVEFAALVLLKEGLGLDTLVATPIAFALATVAEFLKICAILKINKLFHIRQRPRRLVLQYIFRV